MVSASQTGGSVDHSYRPDIDGLRAVAVLAVLAYHFSPNRAPGGFVGVDIFFVISGFLITGIILESIRVGRFSIADFYRRRIRRIFPALALVLLACWLAGSLVLMPNDFKHLGQHVLGGATFTSNLLLYFEEDYFDGDAGYKPLLHLWSLGVEEQFYLFWPLLLFACRSNARARWWLVGVTAAVSFALNIGFVARAPEATFYLPFTRFWELMIGSALALLATSKIEREYRQAWHVSVPDALACAGACALALGFWFIEPGDVFPGWLALLPTVGTALLIYAGPTAWLNRRVLSLRPLVLVGLISYPLYLWHWPILSFGWTIYGWQPPLPVRLAMLACSFLLAWLTYRLLERWIRLPRPVPRVNRLATGLAAAVASMGVVGSLAWSGGIPSASASDPAIRAISEAVLDGTSPEGVEILPGKVDRVALFMGDSHMAQYKPRIERLLREPGASARSVEFRTYGGCPAVPQVERQKRGYCNKVMNAAFERAMHPSVDTVVIAAAWLRLQSMSDFYVVGSGEAPHALSTEEVERVLAAFSNLLRPMVAAGKRVVVLTSTPHGDALDPRHMVSRAHIVPRAQFRTVVSREEVMRENDAMDERVRRAALAAGAIVVEPSAWLCPGGLCATVDEAGRPISPDGWHLRPGFVREHLSALDDLVLVASLAASS